MWAVWWRVRAGLQRDWGVLAVLALVTALAGAVALGALAGARRTDTAVARFLQYAGPTEGEVDAGSQPTLDKVAALPSVAYAERAALMLVFPAIPGGQTTAVPRQSQVITVAVIHRPPEGRAIIVAGRQAVPSRASEVAINEAAARTLNAHIGSVIHLRGYRPDQYQRIMNGVVLRPEVALPGVRVVGIIREPADLTENPDVPTGITFAGPGTIYATAAFYHRFAASVASATSLVFHLKRGAAGLAAFEAQLNRLFGNHVLLDPVSDDRAAAVAAQRGTSLQALALLLFGVIVALAMIVIVAQGVARHAHTASDDFAALRALGFSPRQLFVVALAPGALAAAGGMALAVPIAYGLSALTPIGLARRAEVSPGLSFDAAILLGGAAALALLLTGRAAVTALRVVRTHSGTPVPRTASRGSRIARWMAGGGFPPTAVAGARLAFEPGRDRTAVPVRSAIFGMAVALAALMAVLVFGSSLAHVIDDPVVAGWNWDVTVGNPNSGDIGAQIEPGLRQDPDVAGFTATAMLDGPLLDGRDVPVMGMQRVTGDVAPPVLAGRLPRAPGEIALGGRELRALHKGNGGVVTARGAHGPVSLHIVGQVVLSPEITNEIVPLGSGGVMTLAGAQALSRTPLARNVFPVQLRRPSQAAIARLKQQFPGVVLPAVPPPEMRDLRGVNDLPLALAVLLTLLATATVAHTLITSVRRRGRELAILKAVGFVPRQVRAAVAWQATAIAGTSLIVGLPLGIAVGRWAWTLLAGRFAIESVPVISPLVLLAFPAVLVLANAAAAFPALTAAHTQPATLLTAE